MNQEPCAFFGEFTVAAIVVEQVGFYKILYAFVFLQDGGVVFYALKGM